MSESKNTVLPTPVYVHFNNNNNNNIKKILEIVLQTNFTHTFDPNNTVFYLTGLVCTSYKDTPLVEFIHLVSIFACQVKVALENRNLCCCVL